MNDKIIANINKRICDRTDCFYWQTDRKVTVEVAALIWKDQHSLISNDYLLDQINKELKDTQLAYIQPFDKNAQTSNGNVNSIRVGVLINGQEIIIRCHPQGLKNGYFFVESLAASIALKSGVPTYKTHLIHELQNENDVAYQVIEKLTGGTIESYLNEYPQSEANMVYQMGKMMAKIHQIKVNGFGPFDNEKAKTGELIGIHSTLNDAFNAGLEENLNRLVTYKLFSQEVALKIKMLFNDNKLLDIKDPVLIHNDFADWNLLTDGKEITAVLDWDESVGGDPIQDIACWSTFFAPERLNIFLKGYFSDTKKPDDFEAKFQLMRLRYTISKMALRLKRYQYEKTDFMKSVIERGKTHLSELIEIFELDNKN